MKRPTVPRIEDGEPVPNVNRRQMKTLDMIADDAMDALPHRVFDLADDAVREQIHGWIRSVVAQAAHDIEWAYRRATDSALKQADALMRDPARYRDQKKRRNAQRQAILERNAARLADLAKRKAWDREAGVSDEETTASDSKEKLN